mgnify:CR=1 FL=1
MYKQLGWLLMLVVVSGQAAAKDDYFWGSYGGHQGYFDAPYFGLGFMANSWGAELGFVGHSEYSGQLYYEPPATSQNTLIESDVQTGWPFYISVLKGYAPNDRIAMYASLGLLLWNQCDVVESNASHKRYCSGQTAGAELIPGAGVLYNFGSLTAGFGYQHGIGPLLSIGTDF